MTCNFECKIPFKVIDHYEGETANVINGMIKFIEIRSDDLRYFDFDKELIREFIEFIVNRIKEGNNLDPKSRDYLIRNRLRYPGEY